ncbi:MAG TPA: BACON domain-containing carbohydrate-binding protein [Blastocatellia bacterium]|nr:BACON domain-containing carbohydrate-binding protein [Blastocatellia bacterium]
MAESLKQRILVLVVTLLVTMTAVRAQPPAQWAARGPGGGGALFAPVFSPHNANEIYLACDMSEQFHSTDLGVSWAVTDFRQIQGNREAQVRFTSDPSIRYALDYTGDLTTPARSTDGGATWHQLASDPTGGGAYALFVDDSVTSRVLVSDYSHLYCSSDGGATFAQKFSTASGNGCFVAGAFFDGANIYVGTNLGLLVSTNGGASFALANLSGIPAAQAIVSFAGAKQNATTRFFAVTLNSADVYPGLFTEGSYSSYAGIYALDWGQASWTLKTTGIAAGDEPFFVAMARGNIATAYVAGQQNSTEFPIIYKTIDGGAGWQSVFLTTNNQNIFTGWSGRGGDRDWSYGAGALGFTVAPTDVNRVAYTDLGFVHLTTDGGATWRQMYVNPADQNPMGQLTPKGRTYHSVGLEDTSCWWLTWSDASNLFASYSDIKGTRSTDGGLGWSFNYSGQNYNSTYQSLKHPTTGTLYVATSSVHDMYQSTRLQDSILDAGTGEVLYSIDKGATWQRLHNFAHPVISLAVDPTNTNRMYASVIHSTQGGIFVSSNIQNGGASTWAKLANPPRTEGHPFNVYVLNDGAIVCTYSGRRNSSGTFTASSGVFLSIDGGATWLDRSDTGMRYWTKDILIDPNDATQNTWYVCVYSGWGGPPNGLGGLYRTTNRGQSWTKINSLDRVGSVAINPLNANEMYLTTETNGLWYSNNLSAAPPVFSAVTSYPFRQPERVFFNPYNPAEIWVTSFGNGVRVGSACGYQLAVAGGFFNDGGGSGSVALACAGGCGWTAASNDAWIILTSATSGSGSDVIHFEVRENFTGAPRQGSLTIAGQTYTVIQDAGMADCDYQLTPSGRVVSAAGGSASFSVATAAHCAWQATPNVSWITISSGSPGIGNGVVNYTVAPNLTGVARKGRIRVGNQVFTLKQKGG